MGITADEDNGQLVLIKAATTNSVTNALTTNDLKSGTGATATTVSDTKNGEAHKLVAKNAVELYDKNSTAPSIKSATALADDYVTNGNKAYISGQYQDSINGLKLYDIDGKEMDKDAITAAYLANTTAAPDVKIFTKAPTVAEEGKDYTVETKTNDIVSVKDGYAIYSDPKNENNQFGDQQTELGLDDYKNHFKKVSDFLMDKDGNYVTADKLSNFFDEAGKYKGELYKFDDFGTKTKIGAEQIDDYVDWKKTEAKSEEVVVEEALNFSLQVGADANENNKISIDIESMSAKSLGVENLKVDGKDSTNADAAVDVIAAAIQKVSTQRSALGAVQNRLEHTIANLDNVVENTTAAESQIRDTDMASEMVKYSNNNILAQAGQAMLAQANQANQGVLSLLG